MRRYFIADTDEHAGKNWLVASFGRDSQDNKEHILTTNYVHASEYSEILSTAGGDCHLVADLLNWYHNENGAAHIINDFIVRLRESEKG